MRTGHTGLPRVRRHPVVPAFLLLAFKIDCYTKQTLSPWPLVWVEDYFGRTFPILLRDPSLQRVGRAGRKRRAVTWQAPGRPFLWFEFQKLLTCNEPCTNTQISSRRLFCSFSLRVTRKALLRSARLDKVVAHLSARLCLSRGLTSALRAKLSS